MCACVKDETKAPLAPPEEKNGKPGYSAGFWLGADQRTVYYINTTTIDTTGRCRIQFTSFKVY